MKLNGKRWARLFERYKCECNVWITSKKQKKRHMQFCSYFSTANLNYQEHNVLAETQENQESKSWRDFNDTLKAIENSPSLTVKSDTLEMLADNMNSDILQLAIEMKYKLMLNEPATETILMHLKKLLHKVISFTKNPWQADSFMNIVFGDMETTYLRQKKINSLLPVQPIEVGLFTYLPIRPQLRMMMEKSSYFRESFHSLKVIRKITNMMSSPLDGRTVAKALRNVQTKYIIPLVVYFDEFSEVSPIGAFTKRNKMSVFEWKVIGDSDETHCFLLSFAKSSSFYKSKTSHLNDVLLQILEETSTPLEIILPDLSTELCTIVPVFISADNLAGHQLLGLFEAFSAKVPCGWCHLPKSLFAHVFRENETGLRLRNANGMIDQVWQISKASDVEQQDQLYVFELCYFCCFYSRFHRKSKFGLNGTLSAILDMPSLANNFPHCLVPDCMHDTLQGTASYVVLNTLQFMKKEFSLSISSWNDAVKSFSALADPLEKHRGIPVPSFGQNFSTNQTASQFRTLVSRFGFICHLVKPQLPKTFFQSKNFQAFSKFAKIVSYLHSPILIRGDLAVLESLIANFLKEYKALYGSQEIKNKFHHLIHYPRAMDEYEPSMHTNTLAHERTLRKIKPMIRGRKEILKQIATAASFQAQWHLDLLEERNNCLLSGQQVSKLRTKSKSKMATLFSNLPKELSNVIPDHAVLHKNIRHSGGYFFVSGVVCRDEPSNDWLRKNITFSEIVVIFSCREKLFLVVRDLVFKGYYADFMSAEVERTNSQLYIIPANDLTVRRTFSMKCIRFCKRMKKTLISTVDKTCANSSNSQKKLIVIIDSLPYKLYQQ